MGFPKSKTDKVSSIEPGTHYHMNHRNRGIALIFNHEEFEAKLNFENRRGTNEDVACLEPMLTELGFTVFVYTNNTTEQLKEHIRQAAEYDHTDSDCFVMAVLTHGDGNDKLFAKDGCYSLENLWLPLTAYSCPTLAGKPKLFFIQADLGDSKIPSQVDFLFAYSSVPGSLSLRNQDTGTLFIQALCRVFRNHAYEYDILTLLTFVNQSVAIDCQDCLKEYRKLGIGELKKQIPYVTTSLTRLVQFNRNFSSTAGSVKTFLLNLKLFLYAVYTQFYHDYGITQSYRIINITYNYF